MQLYSKEDKEEIQNNKNLVRLVSAVISHHLRPADHHVFHTEVPAKSLKPVLTIQIYQNNNCAYCAEYKI